MEYIFSCEVCSENYNNKTIIPKVLNCGHTFCSSCIAKLNDLFCPKCRTKIPRNNKPPSNYSILNIIDECKSGKTLIPDIVCRIQDLRKKVKTKFQTINKEIAKKSNQQYIMKRDLDILKCLEAKDLSQESRRSEAREELKKMEKKYEVSSIGSSISVVGVYLNSSFSLQKSKSCIAFLKEIYQALKNNEKVFAVKYIEMEPKWGEISFRDNKLVMRSLSLNNPPKDSKRVQFNDLKEALRKKSYDPFIEITGKNDTSLMVMIELQDKMLCPHFTKLCTGENGPSYRNASYSTTARNLSEGMKSNVRPWSTSYHHCSLSELNCSGCSNPPKRQKKHNGPVTSILSVDISESLPLDYSRNVPCNTECFPDEVILKDRANGGFELNRIESKCILPILGKVNYPFNVLDYVIDDHDQSSRCKILDCGIAIEL